jgi:ribosome-binding protein aMBF1 (putative translation factor)
MNLNDAVRRAVDTAPCSARQLALAAGFDPSLLTRILLGERDATPEVAAKLEAALVAWRDRCAKGAAIIRKANSQRGRKTL